MVDDSLPASPSIRDAYRAIRAGDHRAAQQLARRAAEQDPGLEDPWLILAAYSAPAASIRYLKRALQINPDSGRARQAMRWAVQRLRQKQITASGSLDQSSPGAVMAVADQNIAGASAIPPALVPPSTGTFGRVLKYTWSKRSPCSSPWPWDCTCSSSYSTWAAM